MTGSAALARICGSRRQALAIRLTSRLTGHLTGRLWQRCAGLAQAELDSPQSEAEPIASSLDERLLETPLIAEGAHALGLVARRLDRLPLTLRHRVGKAAAHLVEVAQRRASAQLKGRGDIDADEQCQVAREHDEVPLVRHVEVEVGPRGVSLQAA
eukprot:scaffold123725_cov63-Phaeocystis_antarctica.AAC.2